MKFYMNGVNGQVGRALYSRLAGLLPQPPIRISSRPSVAGDLFHDLRQQDAAICSIMQRGDIFIFLGSFCNYNLCEKDPEFAYTVNVKGTDFLLESLLQRGVRVVFFSSAAVYGNSERPLDEDSNLNGKSVYAATKKYIEKKYIGNKDIKILRLSNIITPDDHFIQYIQSCELKNIPAEIYSGIITSPIGITDVSEIIMKLCTEWNSAPQIMNLCGPDIAGKEEIAAIYKEYVKPGFQYIVVPPSKEYLDGRDTKIPVSPGRLSAFYNKPLTPLRATVISEYSPEKKSSS
jgi:dTDP-4-dehydrorhamnose reductase